jgi:hypothetical protein
MNEMLTNLIKTLVNEFSGDSLSEFCIIYLKENHTEKFLADTFKLNRDSSLLQDKILGAD